MRKTLVVAALAGAALWLAPGAFAAGWCGSGETNVDRPDTTAGAQVHAIVMQPFDAPDNFVADANRLADDVSSVVAWWQGQDPTRVPRFDTAQFPGGNCLDISFVRLSLPSQPFPDSTALFQQMELELADLGFDNPFERYLVYYDGRASDPDVCGIGFGPFDFSATGYASVLLQACQGSSPVPADSVAAHELLHAFGAVPSTDPNNLCTDPSEAGHPCDSTTDVLYPFTDGAPLSQKVLDYHHDDYYAHAPGWPDIQLSAFMHRLDVPQVPLTLTPSGAGTLATDLPGAVCTATCTTQWDPGTAVTVFAAGTPATRFVRWGGACTGTAGCSLTLSAAMSVSALFGPRRIPVRVFVAGKGRVACTPACSKSFVAGRALTLRAVPAKGWRFALWSGGCKGTRPVCRPATDFALGVKARFRRK